MNMESKTPQKEISSKKIEEPSTPVKNQISPVFKTPLSTKNLTPFKSPKRILWKEYKLLNQELIEKEEYVAEAITIHKQEMLKLQSQFDEEKKQLKETILQLKNEIQELKGNIAVYCRFKPSSKERSYEVVVDRAPKGCYNVRLIVPQKSNIGGKIQNKIHEFKYDKVFKSESQETIFKEISPLVTDVLNGLNCCLFVYGQTGSGKTFTMQGEGLGVQRGILPRSVEELFEKKSEEHFFQVQIYEIYKNELFDLKSNKRKKMVSSKEATKTNVITLEETLGLVSEYMKNRRTASTELNKASSRSHSVFRFICKTKTSESSLVLIDLAGSEKVKDSKVDGLEMKEAQSINLSLSNLGKVISAISTKSPHVPYRDSTLTKVLKEYLEGEKSKVSLIVNVSDDLNETLQTLSFGTSANSCKLK